MSRNRHLFCLCLAVLFFLNAVGCGSPAESVEETPDAAISLTTTTLTPKPTPEPTPEPTPDPTPVPTRAPQEGDICTNFPTYDTGVDAEYSYQSDELRIAIDVVEDPDFMQVYYVADIWIRNIRSFRTGLANGAPRSGREAADSLAQREHAIVAMNGDFVKFLAIRNGEYIKGNLSKDDLCVLYNDGTIRIINPNRERFNPKAEIENGAVHAWQFGPTLVHEGVPAEGFSEYGTRHPRCILGYYEPGHYVLVTVDGRTKTAIGMNVYEMVELMHSLGCVEAYNLDGGTSAVLTFMGEIISNPSGSGNDGEGGRNLADMLIFAEYDEAGNAPALDTITDYKKPAADGQGAADGEN